MVALSTINGKMQPKARRSSLTVAIIFNLIISSGCPKASQQKSGGEPTKKWKIHDPERPLPQVVYPGPAAPPFPAPSDAVVLFSGKDLAQWSDGKGGPAAWKVEDGNLEVAPKAGSIQTVQGFGDCQLHLEWATPVPATGEGQGRGNSGVFLMNTYEVQILDSCDNRTYADGMAAAVYGQYPPLVNACRPPGEWQTYDIIFHRPHFDSRGRLIREARMTVIHNGVLVQDNVELLGPTAWKKLVPYQSHPDKLPLSLQDHGSPVRFRNIWIRELT